MKLPPSVFSRTLRVTLKRPHTGRINCEWLCQGVLGKAALKLSVLIAQLMAGNYYPQVSCCSRKDKFDFQLGHIYITLEITKQIAVLPVCHRRLRYQHKLLLVDIGSDERWNSIIFQLLKIASFYWIEIFFTLFLKCHFVLIRASEALSPNSRPIFSLRSTITSSSYQQVLLHAIFSGISYNSLYASFWPSNLYPWSSLSTFVWFP
jgi:hypothetical protein